MRLIEHHGDRTVRVLFMDHPAIEQCRQRVTQEVVARLDDGHHLVAEHPVSGWTFWATQQQMTPPKT